MDRRKALKRIRLGAGFLVIGPTTFSLLQSCKNEPDFEWQPTFLSAGSGFALKEILDVILPKTDTPGASDLNIAQFIDSYMDQVAEEEQRNKFSKGADAFARAFKRDTEKEIGEGSKEEFDAIIAKYLRATPEEQERFVKRNTETQDPMDANPEEDLDADAGTFGYLQSVRDMGIWAWKNSQPIGEEVLWYDPIPGVWIPCGPVEELGNGRAMSL